VKEPIPPAPRGTLFLIVGPSGAGKDTVIDGAKAALAGDPRYLFPRRVVTRPPGTGEDHLPMTVADFEAAEARGAFALAWGAHGLHYGIPRAIDDALAQGRHVIANVSRAVIAEARQRYRPLRIVEVWAPIEVLAERLARRGRENAAEIAERLKRSGAIPVEGADVARIETTGTIEESVGALLAVLNSAAGKA